MQTRIKREIEVWKKHGPDQLSAHRLLAEECNCVHEYAFSRKQHILWFDAQAIPSRDWIRDKVRELSEKLKSEQCLIHQSQVAISLFEGGVRSSELMQGIFDHDVLIVFVLRMRQAVHGGA